MTNQDVINFLNQIRKILLDDKSWLESTIQPINEAFDKAISALQKQEAKNSNESSLTQKGLDTISRQAAIDELKRISFSHWFEYGEYLSEDTREIKIISSSKALEVIEALPSAQPEPSIPISWIEKEIDWLKSIDNGFSNIAAMNISVFVKKWRKENG